MKSRELKKLGFQISNDPQFLNDRYGVNPFVRKRLFELTDKLEDAKKSDLKVVIDFVEKNPDNPMVKDLLYSYYVKFQQLDKAQKLNRQMLQDHPDFLYARTNAAMDLFMENELDQIPELLGQSFDLKKLYPERDVFFVSEVLIYYRTAIFYFASTDQIEKALKYFQVMMDVDSEDINTFVTREFLIMVTADNEFDEDEDDEDWYDEEDWGEDEEEDEDWDDDEDDDDEDLFDDVSDGYQQYLDLGGLKTYDEIPVLPQLKHPELEVLYQDGFDLKVETINALLSLPRQSLIADLESILQDSMDRLYYFYGVSSNNGFNTEHSSFVAHAIFLLAELESFDSLPLILEVISFSEDAVDLYLEDMIDYRFWEPFYKLGHKKLELYYQVLTNPAVDAMATDLLFEMMMRLVELHPERREEVLSWISKLLSFFLEKGKTAEWKSHFLIGNTIVFLETHRISELLPQITQLYKANLVYKSFCGTLKEVKQYINQEYDDEPVSEVRSMAKCYQLVQDLSDEDDDGFLSPENLFSSIQPELPFLSEKKVGRNEPCPCGSGKKYKNCCIDKE